jgi:hypothetical protein
MAKSKKKRKRKPSRRTASVLGRYKGGTMRRVAPFYRTRSPDGRYPV